MSRIVTNTNANSVYKNYTRNNVALGSSLEKLSTGLRINRASDDAAGLAISETLRAQVKGSDAALDVIANATNFINTTDGYLQNVNDMLGRLEELAVSYNDGTKSAADQLNLDAEAIALEAELAAYDTQATFNGTPIFDGNPRTFQVGADSGVTIDIQATGLSDIATALGAVSGLTTLSGAIADIQLAISTVATQRASLGGDQSRFNFRSNALQNYSENASAAEGRIRNADIAKESSNFSRNQILVQASTAMLAQANQSSQNVLSLLRQ
jgi:flagellin